MRTDLEEKQIMEYFDEKYGRNIHSRIKKLKEEQKELEMSAIFCQMKRDPTESDKSKFLDEVSDVLTVVTHLGHCLGYSSLELLNMAYEKNRIRETDPGYKH